MFIEDYQAITCYTKPGLTADSYVAYVTYEVKFRRVDTLAPGLMWCYIVKNEDGNYIIRENVIGDEADYVASQNQTEDVRLLSTQVNERLRQAIESDSLLAGRYKELLNGAVVSDSEETESGQDSQIELIDDGAGTGQAPALERWARESADREELQRQEAVRAQKDQAERRKQGREYLRMAVRKSRRGSSLPGGGS